MATGIAKLTAPLVRDQESRRSHHRAEDHLRLYQGSPPTPGPDQEHPETDTTSARVRATNTRLRALAKMPPGSRAATPERSSRRPLSPVDIHLALRAGRFGDSGWLAACL